MFARTALIAAFVFAASPAYAGADLHDLYDALQTKGQSVTIPAKILARLKLGVPASDIPGKEIIVTETDRDQRGITAFKLADGPCMTMFHVEPDKDDSWLIRFSLDGRILNQEWEEGGYRTYEIKSPQVAEKEIAFWRQRMAGGPRIGAEK
ncbi:MAG TPA: hypothetical protein VH019_02230 [Rhizomicrobium sp.]|nr:hypothetical protein [Rhizomicrobium sp.]